MLFSWKVFLTSFALSPSMKLSFPPLLSHFHLWPNSATPGGFLNICLSQWYSYGNICFLFIQQRLHPMYDSYISFKELFEDEVFLSLTDWKLIRVRDMAYFSSFWTEVEEKKFQRVFSSYSSKEVWGIQSHERWNSSLKAKWQISWKKELFAEI